MTYTPAQLALIEELWLSGKTGAEIAFCLGISRDAALSKIRRMQLTRALRFADEVATWGSVERAGKAVGVTSRRARLMMAAMARKLGPQSA